MMYQAMMMNGGAVIAYNGTALFENLKLEVSLTRRVNFTSSPVEITTEKGKTTILFDGKGRMQRLALVLSEKRGVLVVKLEAEVRNYYDLFRNETLAPEDTVKLHMTPVTAPDGVMSTYMKTPWWQTPNFSRDMTDFPATTQLAVAKFGKYHVHLQPLVDAKLRTEMIGDAVSVFAGVGGLKTLSGTILSISVATDPYTAISETFTAGKELGSIRVPLREEREYPEIFNYFGWCTWNAFYHDVTSEKIFTKLDEFREKGIKLGWVLIDDGWSQYRDQKLSSFCEDREKFPEGLKETVRRIKEEYGIPYVGVWHAFTGYWMGIEPNSELHREQKANLMTTPAGWIIPKLEGECAFKFWDAWHSYLAEQGIDFVKVDNQSSLCTKIDGIMPAAQGVRRMHEALERSVNKNFGGAIINCMGMNYENILTRPGSALNRNSDDFFPERENGFLSHIYQNIYDAPVHSRIHHCDFDMWWTEHESALQSSILRAVSGGPIYISDKIGILDPKYIGLLADENARIDRADQTARPTYDCFYTDCAEAGVPLKVFNSCGENLVVAAFGLSECVAGGEIRLADIPGACGDYVAVDYFTGKRTVMNEKTALSLKLAKNEVALYNLFPIKDGVAKIGITDRFMACAAKETEDMVIAK